MIKEAVEGYLEVLRMKEVQKLKSIVKTDGKYLKILTPEFN